MNARYRIEQWFRRIEQPGEGMNREDVCFLMVQARHLIETSATPDRYRVATFYTDWTVHTALDRSVICFEVLRDITRVIANNINPTSPNITKDISQVIGFPQLRSDLMSLFRDNGLPVILFEYFENWRNFVMCLLWFLAGQPIQFPQNLNSRARRIRDEMLAIPTPHNLRVEALTIIIHEDMFHHQKDVYHWMLQVSGDKEINMLGQVELGETGEAFSPPPPSARAGSE
jgi:hypothetical protein